MNAKTHVAGGFAAGLLFLEASKAGMLNLVPSDLAGSIGCIATAIVGSLAPDIDIKNSTASKAAKPLSTVASGLWGHRTFFHSPLLLLLIYLACNRYAPDAMPVVIAFLFGAVSHLFLDMFNVSGIPLLYPITKRFHFASVKTGGKAEKAICSLLILADTYLLFQALGLWQF